MGNSERIEAVGRVVRGYGGTVHGDTLTGEIDVAFPDVHSATSFRDIAPEVLGCVSADLRKGDHVTDLDAPIVLTLVWPLKPGARVQVADVDSVRVDLVGMRGVVTMRATGATEAYFFRPYGADVDAGPYSRSELTVIQGAK